MNSKKFTLFFIFLIPLFLTLSGCINQKNLEDTITQFEFSKKYEVTVINIIDGDTIDVQLQNKTTIRIRLLGIDTPETNQSKNHINEYQNITDVKCLTNWGIKAKNYTSKTLLNKKIYIEFDENAGFKGGYGRWLTYIYQKNGTDFNKKLLQNGYARVYTSETFSKKETYIQTQKTAINKNQGLWNCKK